MKNILYIIPFCPQPTNSGGKIRILNTIKELSKNNRITILSFYEKETEKNESSKFFSSLNIKHTFFKNNQTKSNLSLLPYWFSNWYSTNIIKYLTQLNFSEFDCVLVETSQLLYLIDYIPKDKNTVFIAEDISTISFWRRLLEVNNFKKIVHFYRLIQIYLYEKKYIQKYKSIVVMSEKDKIFLDNLFNISNSVVSQNGIDKIDFIIKQKNNKPTLGYFGSSTHSPNIKAIKFITNNIASKINNQIIIAGSNNQHLNKHQNNVEFLDYTSSNFKEYYEQIDILVTPIFSGSGSRIKILQSLSYGIPVITTPIGAEGIDISSTYLDIINDYSNPDMWISEINKILNKIDKQDELELKNQLTKYLWKNTLKSLSPLL